MDQGTVVAKLRGDRFRLYAHGPKYVHNSFVPFLYGRLEATNEGSRIVGRFRMHPYVRVFMSVWFGGLVAMSVFVPVLALAGRFNNGRPPFIAMVAPLMFILFGVGLLAFGRWIARGQVSRLLQFLREDLEATPEEDPDLDQTAKRTGADRFPQEAHSPSRVPGSRR